MKPLTVGVRRSGLYCNTCTLPLAEHGVTDESSQQISGPGWEVVTALTSQMVSGLGNEGLMHCSPAIKPLSVDGLGGWPVLIKAVGSRPAPIFSDT